MKTTLLTAEVATIERLAIAAMQAGHAQDAINAWFRIVSLQPNHVIGLTQLGQAAFKQGDFVAAHQAFQRAAECDGTNPRQWVNVALAAQQLKDDAVEESALFKALAVDPYDLLALVLRGAMYERQGKSMSAAGPAGEITEAPAFAEAAISGGRGGSSAAFAGDRGLQQPFPELEIGLEGGGPVQAGGFLETQGGHLEVADGFL